MASSAPDKRVLSARKVPPTSLTTSKQTVSIVSLTNADSAELDLLCKVLLDLVRWRWLVFYAQFFTGSEFGSEFVPTPKDLPISPSEYTAHKARKQAQSIFRRMSSYGLRTDLSSLYQAYLLERKPHQRRTRQRLQPTVFLPISTLMTKTSKRLDIPLRQIESALATYKIYTDELHQNMLTTTIPSLEPAHEKIRVSHMVARNDWPALAETVYEDMQDVSTFSTFPALDGTTSDQWNEMLKFRTAVSRCSTYYFADIRYELQPCECGCSRGKRRAGQPHSKRGGQPVYEYRDDDNNRQKMLDSKCRCSVFCSTVCSKLRYRILGLHALFGCGCRGERQVVYEFSEQQPEQKAARRLRSECSGSQRHTKRALWSGKVKLMPTII